ncbi:sigma-70 family RNA polymerase sigma factor [Roseibium aggregatum]|uniref:RNA polymerase sigma factor n=1 Tax=Roseibium aggregatum TaxID=187304 RepID=A0A926P499_9HYPH|nr:sigma-70 family RNA polymerase sigma factor [Roseibium aggregatum]MBD1549558.1 sigma-70 family RNA polymerase sigma factor [Roseibium aggregatum]
MTGARGGASSDFKRDLLAQLPTLRAFAVSLCGRHDQADDLLQNTILKAWSNQESFTPGTNMKAWLFRILRNDFYSELRVRGRELPDSDGHHTAQLSVQPDQHAALDLKDFARALEALPNDQREAIVLVGASGFSYEEAADICGCPVGTLKSRVNRARAGLRERLSLAEDDDFGPDAAFHAAGRPAKSG